MCVYIYIYIYISFGRHPADIVLSAGNCVEFKPSREGGWSIPSLEGTSGDPPCLREKARRKSPGDRNRDSTGVILTY